MTPPLCALPPTLALRAPQAPYMPCFGPDAAWVAALTVAMLGAWLLRGTGADLLGLQYALGTAKLNPHATWPPEQLEVSLLVPQCH